MYHSPPSHIERHSNSRVRGGIYWYRAGWNISATASWALGAAAGLAAASTTVHEDPLLALTGGVDCGFILSGMVGGLTYLLLTLRAPATATAGVPEPTTVEASA